MHLTIEVQVGLFALVLLLALRSSPLPGRWPLLIGVITVTGSTAAYGAELTGTAAGAGAAELWKALLLLLTALLVVRRILARPSVTIQSIYGALSAYLIVGLMFAACYAAIRYLGDSAFFANHQPANPQTFQYFSFTTTLTPPAAGALREGLPESRGYPAGSSGGSSWTCFLVTLS